MRLFLRMVERCLGTHSPGSNPAARLGAVAFIHRYGSKVNPHLHLHCVVIDRVFNSAAVGVVVLHVASVGGEIRSIASITAGHTVRDILGLDSSLMIRSCGLTICP